MRLTRLFSGIVALLMLCASLSADHGTTIYYDIEKPIKLTGTVTRFVWSNPHVLVYFDVKKSGGSAVHWIGELHSPNGMIQAGWNKGLLKAGDRISVTVFPNRIGAPDGVI